jgi:hypothetical protein
VIVGDLSSAGFQVVLASVPLATGVWLWRHPDELKTRGLSGPLGGFLDSPGYARLFAVLSFALGALVLATAVRVGLE